jgi:hypothetical protein
MGDPALLEAADELQHLLLEGHQLMAELLLGVWGPQVSVVVGNTRLEYPLTSPTRHCCCVCWQHAACSYLDDAVCTGAEVVLLQFKPLLVWKLP